MSDARASVRARDQRVAPHVLARESVIEVIDDIVRGVRNARNDRGSIDDVSARASPDLASGLAGGVLLLSELVRRGHDDLREDLVALLDRVTGDASQTLMSPSLFTGLSGIGFVAQHASQSLGGLIEDPNAELDEALADWLSGPTEEVPCDLVNGIAGIGVYALTRLPRVSALHCLQRIVAHLAARAIGDERGIRWDGLLHVADDRPTANRAARLGVAHGQAGIVGFLTQVHESRCADATSNRLLDGAVDWLIGEKQLMWDQGCEMQREFPSWCWGDPGLAAVLLAAGLVRQTPRWIEFAVRCAHASLLDGPIETRYRDACLCHGAAGAAYLYRRLFSTTREATFAAAANRCIARTLLMRSNYPLGGYRFLLDQPDGSLVWGDCPGLLFGSSGVALVLVSAGYDEPAALDRLLCTPTSS